MIFVERQSLDAIDDVHRALQYAMEIEHATIPPYLVALYSLGTTGNDAIRAILEDIVVQEMGHLALVANLLIAIGGTPRFTDASFVPTYPNGLPMKIGDHDGNDLVVHLAPFSIELVRDTFMVIESPENPLMFPIKPKVELMTALSIDEESYQTIGEFYAALKKRLAASGNTIFTGGDKFQAVAMPPGVFAIRSLADANRAIDLIVQQGEGTTTTPLAGGEGQVAHYYRFEQIVNGLTLVPTPGTPQGYAFAAPAIPFDPSTVAPIITDATMADYAAYPLAARYAAQFDRTYAAMLNALEQGFAGDADALTNAVGLMFDIMVVASKLMLTPVAGAKNASPTFTFVPGPTPSG